MSERRERSAPSEDSFNNDSNLSGHRDGSSIRGVTQSRSIDMAESFDEKDDSSTEKEHGHSVPWTAPQFFRYEGAPMESTGLSIDMFARATVVMSSLFLGPALLELAKEDVRDQCLQFEEDSSEWQDCLDTVRIHGFKPSSLLSNIAVAGGVLGAVFLPLVGAIVDMTPYRKQVGMYSAFFITIIKPAELTIGPETWFAISWLQVLTGVVFCIHTSSIFAYVSEMSDEPNKQAKYNTHSFVVMYASTLIFMVEALLLALFLNTDSVGTARIALSLTTFNCVIAFPIAWKKYFLDRPPLTVVEPGRSIVLSGFQSLFVTSRRIHQEHQALKWLLLAVVFGESANAAVVSIGTTFMVHFLGMDGRDAGIVFLVILFSGPMGSKLGEFIALRSSPVMSAKACLVTFAITQSLAALILTSPERSHYTSIFGVFWGICLGWLHPMFLTTFVTICPSGMHAQMMSLYLFCGTGFTWLPPLSFTICNEFGLPIHISMLTLTIFFLLAILCLYVMGDYELAMEAGKAMTANTGTIVNKHIGIPSQEIDDLDNVEDMDMGGDDADDGSIELPEVS